MTITMLLLAAALVGADPPPASTEVAEQLQKLHKENAAEWHFYLDEDKKSAAKMNAKPVYVWTNPTRGDGQHGSVFVWTSQGRPVVIGSTFSHPEEKRRMLCHEFHSLATGKLFPRRDSEGESWEPKEGISLVAIKDFAKPDASPSKRLLQMKAIARDFSAYSIDYRMERWELRLLPQPLYRYEKPEGDVIDGALFAFVTSAGTDPEVVLAIEARKERDAAAWHYVSVRFSDSNLYVSRGGREVWSSVRDDKNQLHFNPAHTYRLIRDRFIDDPLLQSEK